MFYFQLKIGTELYQRDHEIVYCRQQSLPQSDFQLRIAKALIGGTVP